MWLGFLFILNNLFVCLFVFHSFVIFKVCNNTDLRPPEVTLEVEITSKHGNKPINSCHKLLCLLLFIVVLSF